MIKKMLFIVMICAVPNMSYADSEVAPSFTYKIVQQQDESPISFVLNKEADDYEIHFTGEKISRNLEAVMIMHSENPIKRISDVHSIEFAINGTRNSLSQNGKTLSLDFFIQFRKEVPKNDFLYLCFQIRKSELETVCYLYQIN